MKKTVQIVLVMMTTCMVITCGSDNDSNGTNASNEQFENDVTVPVCPPVATSKDYHAAIDGTADGDGSLDQPWDLPTALLDPDTVAPGDTIWIHEGHYEGTFVVKQDGEPDAPITIAAWPGDRVVLDSAGAIDAPVIQIYRAWTILRDLEITNSNTDRRSSRTTGIYVGGDHISLINLIVHDVGVGISGGQRREDGTQEGTDLELYGSIFYNNGYLGDDRGHGHHLYLTNEQNPFRIEENILFHAYGFGVHNYSATDSKSVQNMELVGNVWFGNGIPGQKLSDGCMIGHDGTESVSGITLRDNMGWAAAPNDRNVRLGWDTPNDDITLTNNYLVGETRFEPEWRSVGMTGNTFIGPVHGINSADYPDNTYLNDAPTENRLFFRTNRYDKGRAHIIVYNWENADAVTVDPGDFMAPGTEYILRNVQDYFAPPLMSGVYDGTPLTVPMTGLTVVSPIGDPAAIPDIKKTGPAFNVFVIQAAVCPN